MVVVAVPRRRRLPTAAAGPVQGGRMAGQDCNRLTRKSYLVPVKGAVHMLLFFDELDLAFSNKGGSSYFKGVVGKNHQFTLIFLHIG